MIDLEHVSKEYKRGGPLALDDINLHVDDGEFVFLLGHSGAGKSTLLKLLLREELPSEGKVTVLGKDVASLHRHQVPYLRRQMGIIFQDFRLIPTMTVYENIAFAMHVTNVKSREISDRVEYMLELVHLEDKAKAYPAQLSGGQQQRVAIARALATNPKVLLCDEATSALDPKTTRQILELIGDINKKLGITVVIITHQMSVVKEVCNHVAILDDGEVVEEGLVSTVFSAPKSAAARHLVFPRGADIDVSDPQQQRRIRLIFRSAKTTSIPLVARLATEEGISATVISANTQKLSEEVYGSMLLGVPNAQFEQAMDFLRSIENLQVEEASVDVQ